MNDLFDADVETSKAKTLEAVQQFAPEQVNRLAKLKKAELASEAERLVVGTGWLPEMLQKMEAPAADASESPIDTDDVPANRDESNNDSRQDSRNDSGSDSSADSAIHSGNDR